MEQRLLSYTANGGSRSRKKFITEVFRPGDEGLLEAIRAKSTVEVLIMQGPLRSPAIGEYIILEHGKRRIADPLTEPNPYTDLEHVLYINLREGWSQVRGKGQLPWMNDHAHKILETLLEIYPRPIDRFDAGEALGKNAVSEGRFRGLIWEVRRIVGEEILAKRARALSRRPMIIIERAG